ncbi:MAG: TM2 domain-containing protein [Chitinophagaceae bacterium]
MTSEQMLMMIPDLQPDELMHLRELSQTMNEGQLQRFVMFYRGKRKEQQTMMLLTIIGFFGVAGIQRFVLGDIGLGILYFVTAGFCGIGTIIDLVNIRRLTTEFNYRQAVESANMAKMIG